MHSKALTHSYWISDAFRGATGNIKTENTSTSGAERQAMYRALFKERIEEDVIKELKRAINHDVPLGNDRFREEIEEMLGKRIQDRRRGRPSKEKLDDGLQAT